MPEISPPSILVDARGLQCPLPVLRLEKAAATLPAGQAIRLLATDPVARVDVPVYCRRAGLDCSLQEAEGVLRFLISRPG